MIPLTTRPVDLFFKRKTFLLLQHFGTTRKFYRLPHFCEAKVSACSAKLSSSPIIFASQSLLLRKSAAPRRGASASYDAPRSTQKDASPFKLPRPSKRDRVMKELEDLGIAYQSLVFEEPESLLWENQERQLKVVASRGTKSRMPGKSFLTRNYVFGHYLCCTPRYVLAIDFTTLSDVIQGDSKQKLKLPTDTRNWTCLAVQDLASKAWVGYALKEGRFNVTDTVTSLGKILDFVGLPRRAELILDQAAPQQHWIHCDLDSCFTNQTFLSFLDDRNIGLSTCYSKSCQNQCVERSFLTVKTLARKQLGLAPRNGKDLPFQGCTWTSVCVAMQQAVDLYNNEKAPSRQQDGLSRADLLEAYDLCAAYLKNLNPSVGNPLQAPIELPTYNPSSGSQELVSYVPPQLARTDNSLQNLILNLYKTFAVTNYLKTKIDSQNLAVKNWDSNQSDAYVQFDYNLLLYAIDRRNALYFAIQEENAKAREMRDIARWRAAEEVSEQRHEQTQDSQETLLVELLELRKFQKKVEEDRLKKAILKEKRANAETQDVRDPVLLEHLQYLLDELLVGNKYTARRRRVACLVMYCLGLRIGEARCLRVHQLQELLRTGGTIVQLSKGGSPRHEVLLSDLEREHCDQYKSDFTVICRGKTGRDFAFTGEDTPDKEFSVNGWNRDINKTVLAPLGQRFSKIYKSHSFRVGKITRMQEAGIELIAVSKVIGHKKQSSTVIYARHPLASPERLKEYAVKADRARLRRNVTEQTIDATPLTIPWTPKKRYEKPKGRPPGSPNKDTGAKLSNRSKAQKKLAPPKEGLSPSDD